MRICVFAIFVIYTFQQTLYLGSCRYFIVSCCIFALWILFLGTGLPQKVLGATEEVGGKKHMEDTISMASSLHSTPPASPQSSPRKGKIIVQASSYYSR